MLSYLVPYLSLSDYGLIGNLSSAALVSRFGSIDWCCLPYLDSPSVFANLLDCDKGGRFQICPSGDYRSEQRYYQRTHVLETSFDTPQGRGILTDWMPMHGSGHARPVIFRRIEVIDGKISWNLLCSPRFEYGAAPGIPESHRGGILFRAQNHHANQQLAHLRSSVADFPFELDRDRTRVSARFTLSVGKPVSFSWGWGREGALFDFEPPRLTAEAWKDWAHRCPEKESCPFGGIWHDAVSRSGLVLKLLLNSCTGALAEAITTSLPGVPGSSRTWDYRYAWIRDGALAIQALARLGYQAESNAFFGWIADILARDGAAALQPVYAIDGGKDLKEREIQGLAGYQGAKPVRVGNLSATRFQLDPYGHVMLAAAEHFHTFGELPEGLWERLVEVADTVCQAWRRPDHGPWEIRTEPEHHTSSKVFCWAALDRAIHLAHGLGMPTRKRWFDEREILHRTICQQGYSTELGAFTMTFGGTEPDAATLMIPLLGFLPPQDPRVKSTITYVRAQLSRGPLLRRYRAPDGLPGRDGEHLLASFLLVATLAHCGEVDEASARLAELCALATPLGLFGEQIDPESGETSGNFPSAAVHVGLVNAALYVSAAREKAIKSGLIRGTSEAVRKNSKDRTG